MGGPLWVTGEVLEEGTMYQCHFSMGDKVICWMGDCPQTPGVQMGGGTGRVWQGLCPPPNPALPHTGRN